MNSGYSGVKGLISDLVNSKDYLKDEDGKESIDNYRIGVTNFLGVDSAEILLSNNIVIGGFNSTGKTTVLKTSYLFMEFLRRLHDNVSLYESYMRYVKVNPKNRIDVGDDDYKRIYKELSISISFLLKEIFLGVFGYTINDSDKFGVDFQLTLYYKTFKVVTVRGGINDDYMGVDFEHLISLPYPRNVHYIESSRVLHNTSTVLNPRTKVCGDYGTITLNESSVMSYEKRLLEDLIRVPTTEIINNYKVWDIESKAIQCDYLIGVDDNPDNIITTDVYGNALVKESTEVLPVSLVGGGVKLLSILKTLVMKTLMKSSRDILFIDEPENGVYPNTQYEISKHLFNGDYKVIILTHSLFITKGALDGNPNTYTFFEDTNIMSKSSIRELYQTLALIVGGY